VFFWGWVASAAQSSSRSRPEVTVSLELGAYLIDPYDAGRCFESQITAMMIGAGDQPETAIKSVAASVDRFRIVFAGAPAS
jgi:hypothetical protein